MWQFKWGTCCLKSCWLHLFYGMDMCSTGVRTLYLGYTTVSVTTRIINIITTYIYPIFAHRESNEMKVGLAKDPGDLQVVMGA